MNTLDTNFLNGRLKKWQEMNSAIQGICDKKISLPSHVEGLCGALPSFFVSSFVAKKIAQKIIASQYGSDEDLARSLDFLAIVPTEKDVLEISQDLKSAIGEARIFQMPWWGTIPYRALGKGSAVFGERAAFLAKLAQGENSPTNKTPRIFIASQRTFLSPLPNPESVRSLAINLKKGQDVDTENLSERLSQIGYTHVPKVSVQGEFALRGEVLDIFAPSEDEAFRITLDFDKIEKIRTFSTETQSAISSLEKIFIPPMKEVLFDEETVAHLRKKIEEYEKNAIGSAQENLENVLTCEQKDKKGARNSTNSESFEGFYGDKKVFLPFTKKAKDVLASRLDELEISGSAAGEELFYPILFDERHSLLDYIGKSATVFYYDYDRQKNAMGALQREFEATYKKARAEEPVFPPFMTLFDFDEILSRHENSIFFRTLHSENSDEDIENLNSEKNESVSHPSNPRSPASNFIAFQSQNSQSFFGNINYLKEQISRLKGEGYSIFIFCDNENQTQRISQILGEEILSQDGRENQGEVFLIPQAISQGFSIASEKILVIQENEIFGRRKRVPKSIHSAKSRAIDTFVELNPGDYVVHANYGIGLFKGIERVKSAGQERDYIKLEYADEDIAFVPIEQANLVQRYIGNEGEKPRLDRIGSKAWENRKNRVKQAVEELAQKLIDLYSRRKTSRGFAFPKDNEWQAAFEAAFPYEDTADQITVTQEIKADMERDVPMDRLICGDVGYGKTEIAMRAAFKAVLGGKQVAFMAPTTILAEQHYETCVERFKNFPVTIKVLSRFVSASEQKKILESLKSGGVDILVGTHRIIQKDVHFKNLGLMIIDEEQRFGVKDKERLKVMKNNIDCLAMSATPIPRTLHMSFLKIRDMSLLTTPPQNRQAIETVIDPYDDERVAKAIRFEVERGGQVFFLHNRVETLEETRRHLEQIVPEMMVDVAHGQMSSDELDDIFRRFKLGGFHVLVSTTIIENGIDIPNVNTIIIDRADMYGVSQLYQLRGRVGRSDRKAYAYLFYPEHKVLSEIAMKRLQVISDFTELGSGFKIAMKDMEIRGAGNLLGRDQSGNVYSVGFDMYLRLLNEAVERLSASEYVPQSEVLMELEYTGFIPDSYVQNPEEKMEIYKKIAGVTSREELDAVYGELLDRFGGVPDEVMSLLTLSEVRIIADSLFITSIKEKSGVTKIEFGKVGNIKIDRLMSLIKENPGTIRLDAAHPNMIIMQTGKIGLKEKSAFISEKLDRLAN